jgi:hydrogenase maturation protease
MTDLKVLGIGSPFGDDQLGWEVVKLLQQRPTLLAFTSNQLQLLYCDRPGMHLLELMRDAQTVFLIDAVKTGAPIGSLHRFQNNEIKAVRTSLSTHGLGVAEAIEMGETLHLLPPNLILYGVEIEEVQFQFTHSEPIEKAIETLGLRLENDIFIEMKNFIKS